MPAQRIEGLHLTAEAMSMAPTREAVIDGRHRWKSDVRQGTSPVRDG